MPNAQYRQHAATQRRTVTTTMARPPRICSSAGCPSAMPCATHSRKPFATSQYTAGRPWRRLRLEILERDGYVCQLQLKGCSVTATVIDHKYNRARGGSDHRANLQAACKPCNDRKSHDESAIGRNQNKTTTKQRTSSAPLLTRVQHQVN